MEHDNNRVKIWPSKHTTLRQSPTWLSLKRQVKPFKQNPNVSKLWHLGPRSGGIFDMIPKASWLKGHVLPKEQMFPVLIYSIRG